MISEMSGILDQVRDRPQERQDHVEAHHSAPAST